MHRTVWANIRSALASTSGLPFLFLSGAGNELSDTPGGGPIKPAGHMAGYPVYTNRWMPILVTAVTASTNFIIFGNMKACAFGDKGDMRVGNFQSGSFGGKEIALSDQTGIVYKHRHAFVVVLPKAFVVVSTSAS
jgi:HK97 family phage major capsid protein